MREIRYPILKYGDIIEVPVENIPATVTTGSFEIKVSVPRGVTFAEAVIPKGRYNVQTNTWEVGYVQQGEIIDGLLYFKIDDDRYTPYDFKFFVGNVPVCEQYCVRINGLTCSALSGCKGGSYSTNDIRITVPAYVDPTNPVIYRDDITAGQKYPCPNPEHRWETYADGTIDPLSTPDAVKYQPKLNFVGTDIATFSTVCNGEVVSRTTVLLSVANATPTPAYDRIPFNLKNTQQYQGSVGVSDVKCTEGATTKWLLEGQRIANGVLNPPAPTNAAGVVITEWDQATGDYTLNIPAGFRGQIRVEYVIECNASNQNLITPVSYDTVYVGDDIPGQLVKEGAGYKLYDNPTTTVAADSVLLLEVGDAPLDKTLYGPVNTIAGTNVSVAEAANSIIHGENITVHADPADNGEITDTAIFGQDHQVAIATEFDRSLMAGFNHRLSNGHIGRSLIWGDSHIIDSKDATKHRDKGIESSQVGGAGTVVEGTHWNALYIGQNVKGYSEADKQVLSPYILGSQLTELDARPGDSTSVQPSGLKSKVIAYSGAIGDLQSVIKPEAGSSIEHVNLLSTKWVEIEGGNHVTVLGVKGTSNAAKWKPNTARSEVTYLSNLHIVREPERLDGRIYGVRLKVNIDSKVPNTATGTDITLQNPITVGNGFDVGDTIRITDSVGSRHFATITAVDGTLTVITVDIDHDLIDDTTTSTMFAEDITMGDQPFRFDDLEILARSNDTDDDGRVEVLNRDTFTKFVTDVYNAQAYGGMLVRERSTDDPTKEGYKLRLNGSTIIGQDTVNLKQQGDAPIDDAIYTPNTVIADTDFDLTTGTSLSNFAVLGSSNVSIAQSQSHSVILGIDGGATKWGPSTTATESVYMGNAYIVRDPNTSFGYEIQGSFSITAQQVVAPNVQLSIDDSNTVLLNLFTAGSTVMVEDDQGVRHDTTVVSSTQSGTTLNIVVAIPIAGTYDTIHYVARGATQMPHNFEVLVRNNYDGNDGRVEVASKELIDEIVRTSINNIDDLTDVQASSMHRSGTGTPIHVTWDPTKYTAGTKTLEVDVDPTGASTTLPHPYPGVAAAFPQYKGDMSKWMDNGRVREGRMIEFTTTQLRLLKFHIVEDQTPNTAVGTLVLSDDPTRFLKPGETLQSFVILDDIATNPPQHYDILMHNGEEWVAKSFEQIMQELPQKDANPVGTIIMFANINPPSGYLLCNGQAVDPVLYPDLHGLIGDHVPDLRDQFVKGASTQAQIDGFTRHQDTTRRPRNDFSVRANGNTSSNGNHRHSFTRHGYNTDGGWSGGDALWTVTKGPAFTKTTNYNGNHTHSVTVNGTVNGGGDTETAPKHVMLAYMIKATM